MQIDMFHFYESDAEEYLSKNCPDEGNHRRVTDSRFTDVCRISKKKDTEIPEESEWLETTNQTFMKQIGESQKKSTVSSTTKLQ